MHPGEYRIIAGFLCAVVVMIMPYYIGGIAASKWCDGETYEYPAGPGTGLFGNAVGCMGEWVYSSGPIPYIAYESLRWTVFIAGMIVGFTCYRAYRMNVLAGYFVSIGLVFNPIVRLGTSRASWVLLDEIALVSFAILLVFLWRTAPLLDDSPVVA